ncbi:MAG: LysR family transcriptional regulator, partial [Azoarcus sp.]|nr:LysR family transcriptional regulator [Azoarcus sp.]
MNIHAVDLNLLKVFEAVYLERSVSRAAVRLELTQPSVSHGLTRLRLLFGDPLFVRARAGVEPTMVAERIAGPVQQALRVLQATLDEHTHFDPARSSRSFRLHMSDFGEVIFLPQLMRALQQRAPGVRIETRQLAGAELAAALDSGQIDLAIGYLPALEEGFDSRHVVTDEYVILAPRIPGRNGGADALAGMDYIAVTSHPQTLAILRECGLLERVKLWVPHFMVVPAILAERDFAVVVPLQVVNAFRPRGR